MATPRFLSHPTPSIQISPAVTYLDNPSIYDSRPEGAMLSTSHMVGAAPSSDYTYRAPSPPHIHIPQAPDDKKLTLSTTHNYACPPSQRQILSQILALNSQPISNKEWKYDQRRRAQPILPFIYLGPSSAARDLDVLRAQGITMLLVIRDASMVQSKFLSGEKAATELGIEASAIDVTGNTQLIAAFPRAIDVINDHLVRVFQHRRQNGDSNITGKVLVFCESGNERSATVVAAYLMHMFGLNEVEAIQYVQTQRFCVAFDDGLKHLLRAYADILRAKSNVSVSIEELGGAEMMVQRQRDVSMTRAKRGRDEVEDDDNRMDVDGGTMRDDEERFGRRSAFVPFRDVSQSREAGMRTF